MDTYSIVKQGETIGNTSRHIPIYPFTFSDGETTNLTYEGAVERVNGRNKIARMQAEYEKEAAADRAKIAALRAELNGDKGVPPTKIDVTTGKGVPGGFDAASVKVPDKEASSLGSSISSISSTSSGLVAAAAAMAAGGMPSIPGIMGGIKKLDALKSKYSTKLSNALKAPNFAKKFNLPSAPKPPSIPDYKSMGIPSVPAMPATPPTPNMSSTPTVPSLPSTPTVPSVPTALSTKTIPKLPTG